MSFKGMPHKALAVVEPDGTLELVGCVMDHGIDDAKTLRDATFLAAPTFAVGLWARHERALSRGQLWSDQEERSL